MNSKTESKNVEKKSDANQGPPQIGIVSQYIKDLSFENPNAPNSVENPEYPNVNVNVEVQAKTSSDETYEVNIHIVAEAKDGDTTTFILDLTYGGLFRVIGVPKEQVQPALLIECPRLIFPFARRVVADVTRDGGFPPLLLNPMDFLALFRENIAKRRAQQENGLNSEPQSQ
tara:strand:+ start:361 stop:876 length:516 start_codon:yes stop_codon:yes gene_type:complete